MLLPTKPGTPEPIVHTNEIRIVYDGLERTPRIRHPEGLALASDGSLFCGSETGAVYRLPPPYSTAIEIGNTKGLLLGVALDSAGNLYLCDEDQSKVFRLAEDDGSLELLSSIEQAADIHIPNVPVVDEPRGMLYVSDSFSVTQPGPGLWGFDLERGTGRIWIKEPLFFANGLALSPSGDEIYIVESLGRRILAADLDGPPARRRWRVVKRNILGVPDGLAFGPNGELYVSLYEPSAILRLYRGELDILAYDSTAQILNRPTNVAIDGREMYIANFGRWHISALTLPTVPSGGSLSCR